MKDCQGVGVRLGGGEVDGHQYGQSNDVRGTWLLRVSRGTTMPLYHGLLKLVAGPSFSKPWQWYAWLGWAVASNRVRSMIDWWVARFSRTLFPWQYSGDVQPIYIPHDNVLDRTLEGTPLACHPAFKAWVSRHPVTSLLRCTCCNFKNCLPLVDRLTLDPCAFRCLDGLYTDPQLFKWRARCDRGVGSIFGRSHLCLRRISQQLKMMNCWIPTILSLTHLLCLITKL